MVRSIKIKNIHLFIILLVIACIAFSIRTIKLSERPLHNDESNQAIKFKGLLEKNIYIYDPYEHHGPTLYYATLPFAWLQSGRDFKAVNEVTIRIVPVIFCTGLILLLIFIFDGFSKIGIILSAIFIAVSPAMFYYSRFYIQEILLVFFALAIIVFLWRYVQSGKLLWGILAGINLGLMHATKETFIITITIMVIAFIISNFYVKKSIKDLTSNMDYRHLLVIGFAAILTSITLFSSFFTNLKGPLNSVLTYKTYFERAFEARHNHPFYFYLQRLLFTVFSRKIILSEAAIFIFAVIGGINILTKKKKNQFNVFFCFYTILLILVYSIIPYKTPWIMTNFLLPVIILAGNGAGDLIDSKNKYVKLISVIILAGILYNLSLQLYWTGLKYPADARNPYTYVQTVNDFKGLIERIEDISKFHNNDEMLIVVIAPPDRTWPIPWYLRKFKYVGYWLEPGSVPDELDPPVIIVSSGQEDKLDKNIFGKYQKEYYGLRTNVLLSLYIKNDLYKKYLANLN